MEKIKTKYQLIISLLVLGGFIFLALNKNSKASYENADYQYEAWADKGGYYIYLPWLINTGLDADKFNSDTPEKVGHGFKIEEGVLRSKYSVGVAIMQLPFYLIGHCNALLVYQDPSGFEKVYMNWMGVGSVFYLWLGLILSVKLFSKLTNLRNVFLAIIFIVFGTNLFYYAFDETLMSHVYSFFLITLFSYGLLSEKRFNLFALVSIGILIIVLRPTNLVYIFAISLMFKDNFKSSIPTISSKYVVYLIPGLVIILVQLIYWYYAYGVLYPVGYSGEGFDHFLTPEILKVLFEPNNGWLVYAWPIFLGIGAGFIILRENTFGKKVLYLTLTIACVYTYITASWWTYTFGCGLGSRNFVDFSFLWILLLSMVLSRLETNRKLYHGWIVLNMIFVVSNMMITYHYDNCWFGNENWDWQTYFNLIQ